MKKFAIFLIILLLASPFLLVKLRVFFPWSIRSRIEMVAFQGRLLDKRLGFIPFTDKVKLKSQGLDIVGDIFPAKSGKRPYPGIVLLHGSSRWGRKIAICQLLAKRLAARGYVVLAIDVRGFGDSDDPANINKLSSWDVKPDVSAAIDYLQSRKDVDPERIYMIGHSMGGTYALNAATCDDRIKKVVAIGPGRRHLERVAREKEQHQHIARFSYVRRLPKLIPKHVYITHTAQVCLENNYEYFAQKNHIPILLMDAALESAPDKEFLKQYYLKMTPPKQYFTIPDTGHYLSIVGFERFYKIPLLWRLMVYDKKSIATVVQHIDSFLK